MEIRKILIRLDDICPTMDYEQLNIAIEKMDKYSIKPLIGVIPDCRDNDLLLESEHPDFWEYIKSLRDKGYTIAMHGVNHELNSMHKGIVNNRIGSEFSGVPLEEQIRKIELGKNILKSHGIETDIFFAPAHSYDKNTIKALAACGFKYMSDGKSKKPYKKDGVICIPCRFNGCPTIRKTGYYTAVFHAHEWVRIEKKYDYHSFCDLIEKYHDDIVSFDDYSRRKCGNTYFQHLDEYVFILWIFKVKPMLSKMYNSLKKLLS